MERRIEATVAVAVPFPAAADAFRDGGLGVLLGDTDVGIQCHSNVVRVSLSVAPLHADRGVVPFHGDLELHADGARSALTLRGAYDFWLPSTARYGDGLLLHRLVRRSLTLLLEDLAVALRVHARAMRRARTGDGIEVQA
jgi:hypothetical protein